MSADFLTDFASWLAGAAGLNYGTDLLRFQFGQDPGTQSYVTTTGGAARAASPVMPVTLQVMSKGAGPNEALARAMALYDVIYPPPQRQPRRMIDLSADWRAVSIDAVQPPYDLGVMADDERHVVFNLQVRAARKT